MITLPYILGGAAVVALGTLAVLGLCRAAAIADRQLESFDEHADEALAVVADDRLVERLRGEFNAPAGSVVDTLLDVLKRTVDERDEARADRQLLATESGVLRDELAEHRRVWGPGIDGEVRAA